MSNQDELDESSQDLNRYFDNTSHTIFDEITSTQKESFFETPENLFEAPENATLNNLEPHRDAWIPPEQTIRILRTVATSPGSPNVDPDDLTMPGLTLQEELVDPTRKAVIHFLGEEEVLHRQSLKISDVTHDERGLRQLIQAGCLRAAINLTGRLIPLYGQGFGKINQPSKHSPTSLQLWFTRLCLLAKIRLTETLETEAKSFGDLTKPDIFYTFYPELYGTRSGSMASFSFRLLLAEVPSYCGKPRQTLDNLFKLFAVVKKMIKNLEAGLSEDGSKAKFAPVERDESLKLWRSRRSRILISIANCALFMKNFSLVIDILEQLRQSSEAKETLVSAMGRVYLTLGDVSAAEQKFSEIRKGVASLREYVDRGLTAIAQNAFQEAYECFSNALKLQPTNIMLINNLAVCLLYLGKLDDAVRLMDGAVEKNPMEVLQESLLLNVSTLYELHTTHSKQSKLELLRQLNRCKGDSIDMQCLKLIT